MPLNTVGDDSQARSCWCVCVSVVSKSGYCLWMWGSGMFVAGFSMAFSGFGLRKRRLPFSVGIQNLEPIMIPDASTSLEFE